MEFPIRINKYLAEKNIASRREADVLIEAGKVLVNGIPAVIGQKIGERDEVVLAGTPRSKRYLAYYKPRGVITHSPASGEIDIHMRLKKDYGMEGVNPVGRLDKDSEGLIILSDDGRITGRLLDPEAGHPKLYQVTVDKHITGPFLKQLEQGVDIEGYLTKPAKAEKISDKQLSITLTEGKKHQIRRMCAALGYQVQSLKRTQIMDIILGDIKPGQFRKISGPELADFLQKLGL